MCPPKVYIAGPFFNEPQLALIKRIECLLMDRQYPFFSPRLQPANAPGGITPELADQILRTNVENIEDCDLVLAVLDWLLPTHQSVRLVTYDEIGNLVNIPDSGTVFELGFTYARRHQYGVPQVFGLTARPPTAKLNVMLARACDGVVHLDNLENFFREEGHDPSFAPKWTGAMQ